MRSNRWRPFADTGRLHIKLAGAGIGPISAAIIVAGIAIGAAVLISDHEDSDSN